MKKRIVPVLSLFFILYFSLTCQAMTYSNMRYGFTFIYPDNYIQINNPGVVFQALNGQKEFHIIINNRAVNELSFISEEDALKKLLDKFYADVAGQAYSPIEFKVLNHLFKRTNSGEHPMTIINYAMFLPSGEKRFCVLGTVVSKGIIYSFYYLTPSFPSKEELDEAMFCLRSFYEMQSK